MVTSAVLWIIGACFFYHKHFTTVFLRIFWGKVPQEWQTTVDPHSNLVIKGKKNHHKIISIAIIFLSKIMVMIKLQKERENYSWYNLQIDILIRYVKLPI